jgi:hypothetical protein
MQNTHVFLANNPIPISMRIHHMPLDYVKIVSLYLRLWHHLMQVC